MTHDKRYWFNVVEEAVLNPAFEGYRGGRVEIYDEEFNDEYSIAEASFLLPAEFFEGFRKLWDGKESDLLPQINWKREPAEQIPVRSAEVLFSVLNDWVMAKRPAGWSEERHRANPAINCAGGVEKRMVRACFGLPLETK